MLYKGQFSGAPTSLVPLALSCQWFHPAVVSPVGEEPASACHRNAGSTPELFLKGEAALLFAVLFNRAGVAGHSHSGL
jgi:hypothetical protein